MVSHSSKHGSKTRCANGIELSFNGNVWTFNVAWICWSIVEKYLSPSQQFQHCIKYVNDAEVQQHNILQRRCANEALAVLQHSCCTHRRWKYAEPVLLAIPRGSALQPRRWTEDSYETRVAALRGSNYITKQQKHAGWCSVRYSNMADETEQLSCVNV